MILADEPTGNLDTTTGERILELLRQFTDDNKIVLVVTHNPEIADIADRVVYLRDGEVESEQFQEVAR
jgi:putative ABC transport system ATP-binding protein